MEKIQVITRPALEKGRNWFSKLFFLWVNELLVEGSKKPFEINDLFNVLDHERIDYVIEGDNKEQAKYSHETTFKQLMRQIKPLLIKCIIFSAFASLLQVKIQLILQFAGPIFLNLILIYLGDNSAPTYQGYIFATAMFLGQVIRTFFDQHSKNNGAKAGLMTINRLFYRIFRKLLTISTQAKKHYDVGKINTIVLINCQEIAAFFVFFPIICGSPLTVVLATIYIIVQIGWIGLFGPILLLLFTLGLNKLQVLTILQRRKMLIFSSQRSKLANEFFQGIRIIKYYAWERFVHQSFNDLRAQELLLCREVASLRGLIEALQIVQPTLIAITMFGVLVATGKELTVTIVFTVITLLNLIQFPIRILIMAQQMYLSFRLAFDRVDALLGAEDRQQMQELEQKQYQIQTEGASLSWESFNAITQYEKFSHLFEQKLQQKAPVKQKEDAKVFLPLTDTQASVQQGIEKIYINNLNFTVAPGQMIAFIGQVGCGKSSIIQAILGELNLISGNIQSRGTVAYISQNVWLRNATIRDNIIFGYPYDSDRLKHVIKISQLDDDLANLSGGDMTEVGERGINLSGGQKQRISIARAVYSQSDTYLIDDCLSALDSYVGKKVFHDVIEKELAGKTRIMVTHQLSYLKFFDKVVIVQGGAIMEVDTFKNMQNNPMSKLKDLQVKLEEIELQEFKEEESIAAQDHSNLDQPRKNSEIKNRFRTISLLKSVKDMDKKEEKKEHVKQVEGQMIKSEEQSTGTIPWLIYQFYFSQGGSYQVVVSLIIFILAQAVRQLCDWWLGMWSANTFYLTTGVYIAIYGGMMIIASIMFYIRYKMFSQVTTKSSQVIFELLVNKIMKAPLSWFDITPLGRIITRCTKNVDDVDFTLSAQMQFSLYMIISLFVTFVMITIITPYFAIVCIIISTYFFYLIKYYLLTAREIKRIGDLAKAPLIGIVQEALQGVHIIRPFGRQQFYMEKFCQACERHTAALFHEQWCQRWMSIRTGMFGAFIIAAAAYFGVASKPPNENHTHAALIGLNLSYAISIQIMLPFMVDLITQTETTMNSVQRIHSYVYDLPSEREYDTPVPAKDTWPTQGQFTLTNVSFKYRNELENVIHKISFQINAREKVGVIGRTGSGKSTLTLGLLRILELSAGDDKNKGSIVLDGVNIEDIGLYHLRSKISIIPQDPVLFSGDLRKNIDPFNVYSDRDMISCLKKVSLYEILVLKSMTQDTSPNKSKITEKDQDVQQKLLKGINGTEDSTILKIKVEEGGSNFSLGERQLICLCRALIRQPQVLLMDEATASIDEKTDFIIQKMIQTEFKNSTVITIAHRLNTIIQYDRILVLAQGTIEEYDTPQNLLNKSTSYLTKMVSEFGSDYLQQMKQLADKKDQ